MGAVGWLRNRTSRLRFWAAAARKNCLWKETVLHEFERLGDANDGAIPIAGLIFDAAGNLYGTTWAGGDYGGGTVFRLTQCGKGKWTDARNH